MQRLSRSLLLAALATAACHEESSGTSSAPPSATNLGLSAQRFVGAGDRWLVGVSEAEQGADLDGDADTLDEVLHWIDTASGTVQNTGIALASHVGRGDVVVNPIAYGSTFVFAASEPAMEGVDRNGDGDGLDAVLTLIDPETGFVENLGWAVTRFALAGDVVAFDVPEVGQGVGDLDGDGLVDPGNSVPFFFDLRTGESWSSGLRGARVLAGDGARVALSELEAKVGDQNGDGDDEDLVLAFYELARRVRQSAGLAIPTFAGFPAVPVPHGGQWAAHVDERAQGLGDLDGDGFLGNALFFVDPATADAFVFPVPGAAVLPVAEVVPFVVAESAGGFFFPWLVDASTGDVEFVDWASAGLQGLGRKLVLSVTEEEQGEDLDGNGSLDGIVPVLLDPESLGTLEIAIDGLALAAGERIWIVSGEDHARSDWNGDGDRADQVLHVWNAVTGELENTRLDLGRGDLSFCTETAVLFLRSEAREGLDLNGDGDRADFVTHLYDDVARRTWNLGLASDFLLGVGGQGSRGFLLVSEAGQGTDLNGDGDALDRRVLHLVTP